MRLTVLTSVGTTRGQGIIKVVVVVLAVSIGTTRGQGIIRVVVVPVIVVLVPVIVVLVRYFCDILIF